MGSWGEGPFDNDDASDWAYDFDGVDEATGLQLIAGALDLSGRGDYLRAWDGAAAVAAATVVSWLNDPGTISSSPYSEATEAWVRTARPTSNASLTAAALAAIDRVRSPKSELAELWADGDDTAWRESLTEIESHLRTHS